MKDKSHHKTLRLWPGVVAVILLLVARFGIKAAVPGFDGFSKGMMGSMAFAAVFVVWWLFLSRAAWIERLAFFGLMIAGMAGTWFLKDESMGPLWLIGYAMPLLLTSFVVAAVAARKLADGPRRMIMTAVILLFTLGWTAARTTGIDGDHVAEFGLRFQGESDAWSQANVGLTSSGQAEAGDSDDSGAGDIWPGFRGAARNGNVANVPIATDWQKAPLDMLWRGPVGAGWSSFAVRGDYFYTQEQQGDYEAVTCYHMETGEPVWQYRDEVRFFESNAGAGPRGTPTLSGSHIYALGATGILNALEASSGNLVWSRNVAEENQVALPDWGFSSSPLVIDGLVVVAIESKLAAYDAATGDPRWSDDGTGPSYSSPHLATVDGVPQILQLTGNGLSGVNPADGRQLWEHSWGGFPMIQPAMTEDGDILVSVTGQTGVRRLSVARQNDEWKVEERWTSLKLKPYFNDFVVHGNHAYGFDGRILACIDLRDGSRVWKGGRYGNGQLVLLPEQNLLLVLSEKGEVALVNATPDGYTERASWKAIEGKTWNHPVLAGDVLLVRNAEEMAGFRVAPADA